MKLWVHGDMTKTQLVQLIRLCAELSADDPERPLAVRIYTDDMKVVDAAELLQETGIVFLPMTFLDLGEGKEGGS